MATASDFNIGQSVQDKSNSAIKGVVISNKLSDGDHMVAVERSDGTLCKVAVSTIKIVISMEEEFELFRSQVNAKLSQAANLISEANALAATQYKNLQSYDTEAEEAMFDSHLLDEAMRDSGWNTSSWHC